MSNYLITTSGNKLISAAMRKIGALGVGIALPSEDQAICLEALNGMLDSWNTESLAVYGRTQVSKVLTPLTALYTIGEGADIDTPRPITIDDGSALMKVNGVDYPLDVINFEQYGSIPVKTLSTRPLKLYYDSSLSSQGWGNINLWPIPDQAYTLMLWLEQQIKQIANGATSYQMPPGYVRAIEHNLAIEIAPEFGKQPPAAVVAIAAESRGNIKRANSVPRVMRVDPALIWRGYGVKDFGMIRGGGGSLPNPDFLQVSTSMTIPGDIRWLLVQATAVADISLALPPNAIKGDIVTVVKVDNNAGVVTITGSGDLLPYDLVNKDQTVTLIYDGSVWTLQAGN